VKVEYFYWSRYSIKMLTKQAHAIKNTLQKNKLYNRLWKNQSYNFVRQFKDIILRDVIYSNWDKNWFQVLKSTRDCYTEFDSSFHLEYAGTKVYEIWKNGIEYVQKNASDYSIIVGNQYNGLQPKSKSFYIGNTRQ